MANSTTHAANQQALRLAKAVEARNAQAAAAEAKKVRDELAQAKGRLKQAQTAAAAAKQARERADALAAQVKQAEGARDEFKESVEKLTADKSNVDAKLRDVNANLT